MRRPAGVEWANPALAPARARSHSVASFNWTNNMSTLQWHRLGRVDDLKAKPLQQFQAGEVVLALSYRDGEFGAKSLIS
jgi:hypothetical protein